MNTSLIKLDLVSPSISVSDAARTERDALLVVAHNVSVVATPEAAESAAETLKEIKTFTRSLETSRTEVKQPVLEIGRRIDSLAKEITAELETEAGRISKLLGAYQAEQFRKEEEARRRAYEEEQRILAEAARKAQEAAEHSRNQASFDKKLETINEAATAQIAESKAAVAKAAPRTFAGTATREEICFEVLDVEALYRAMPLLVTLQPNNTAIRGVLKAYPDKPLPGVRVWKESKMIVRGA
jgi:hypothetical protein